MQGNQPYTFGFLLTHTLLLVAIFIGIMVRFKGLGHWPLAEDEYYFAQSILNIIKHGLPEFDCGGFYNRGLIQQYITAPLLLFSSNAEWALRLPPVVFNLLGIPAVYLIGRKLGGYVVASVATALFCLSLWEIEFARFARMYALFQTLFLWQIVLLIKATQGNNYKAINGMYLLALATNFVYAGAIFLVVLCFIPFVLKSLRLRKQDIIWLAGISVFTVIYRLIDFELWGALPELPPDLLFSESKHFIPIAIPPTLLLTILTKPTWLLLGLFPLVLMIRNISVFIRRARVKFSVEIAVSLMILLCSVFNLFLLSGIIFIAAYLLEVYEDKSLTKNFAKV